MSALASSRREIPWPMPMVVGMAAMVRRPRTIFAVRRRCRGKRGIVAYARGNGLGRGSRRLGGAHAGDGRFSHGVPWALFGCEILPMKIAAWLRGKRNGNIVESKSHGRRASERPIHQNLYEDRAYHRKFGFFGLLSITLYPIAYYIAYIYN